MKRERSPSKVLHSYTTPQPSTNINRIHTVFHSVAVVGLFYYRLTRLFSGDAQPLLPWILMTFAELLLAITWLVQQAFRLRPLIREVHPENITIPDSDLPKVDVYVVTVDPSKEPIEDVMNTVISALALDYPVEKLAVYLSDDGGVPLTLFAVREACAFAKHWVPFCRKYRLKNICPKAFFSRMADDERLLRSNSSEFKADEQQMKSLYEQFKKKVEKARERGEIKDTIVPDRPPYIEILHDNKSDDQAKLPLLVYVSRERRPSYPHRYKGGALNALLRVSGLMSNAPYMMVLDCDMFCNEATSARQAMCFHLDPKMSQTFAFVQYPQTFYNIGKDDIYDAQGRTTYKSQWHGMDGLRGPLLSGTGYYMKKKALFGTPNKNSVSNIIGEETDGHSISYNAKLEKARVLASCTFEQNTNWGKEIGFSYASLLESSFTGYLLHCRGWTSVYYYPKRPAFLGCAPTDLKDLSSQLLKWVSGLLQVGLSRFNPITYGMSSMSILQCMCYCYFMYIPLYCPALLLYGTVPLLCFFNGIPLFPKVTSPWFWLFATIFASSIFEQLYEVLCTGGSLKICWNEYRIWMIQSVTGLLFGCIDAITNLLGLGKGSFRLSNKAVDKEKVKRYEKGKFNFEGAGKFVIPLAILIILNAVCFIGGVKRMISEWKFEEMCGQFLLSSFLLYVSYSLIEGIIAMRKQ
ncbi:Cellulose synthase-like protein G2 [Camellia lanceoleosa]|uniref:Cellulose synthase-like protein G2 n=1 Tax=Camellia lanceoleosa TaxID=1840588 RepID=A0ACC0HJP7_9ERIC|nr:Cellulose synthase-like protein G2 [Camellia lanceoleosa]